MTATVTKLVDRQGNTVYPETKVEAIVDGIGLLAQDSSGTATIEQSLLDNYYTKAQTDSKIPVVDSSLSISSTNAVQNSVITGQINNLKNRFTAPSATLVTDQFANASGNKTYQLSRLAWACFYMESDTSSSLSNSCGFKISLSPNGTTWTLADKFNSTSGYPKFGSVGAVVPPSWYIKVEWWGMNATSGQKHLYYVYLDNQ